MSPLELAAIDAAAEAERFRAEAARALRLEDQSNLLYDVATDAIDAYDRAKERAKTLRQLADHHGGAYNAWAAV